MRESTASVVLTSVPPNSRLGDVFGTDGPTLPDVLLSFILSWLH
jgi:hypothetical protein